MRTLSALDWVVVAAYLALALGAGLIGTRKAGRSMGDFFLSGRSLPWWLAGVSMAATNFSIDTPLAITKYVSREGIGGVWFFWSSAISVLLAAFLFSRLWRRAEVITDAELVELRYSGRPAAALRLIKGCYFGVFINCYVLGWVIRAVMKVMSGVTDVPVPWVLAACVAVAVTYTLAAGLKGVVWTDFFQYAIALGGSTVLAIYAVRAAGGIDGLLVGLDAQVGPGAGARLTSFVPAFGEGASVFLVYALVQWWAHKYSDGGGKHIQRMMACKTEGHAQGATVLFAALNYALQVWPWILTALAAIVVLGPLDDPEMGYPLMMARLLPAGLLGLLVVTMLGAFMSTVDTHLNLGAAYVVNDIYRRFVRKDASERHYVLASRLTMVALLAVSVGVALSIESIGDAWKFVLSFAAGAGLPWVLRWFWWRVNAWTEVSAMLASGVLATWLVVAYPDLAYTTRLLWVVGGSTLVWLVVTYATAAVPDETLLRFLERVRPGSPGWRRLYRRYDLTPDRYLARGLLDWLLGVACLFAANFAIGALLLGRTPTAAWLAAVAAVAGGVLVVRVRRQRADVVASTSR